MNFNIFQYIVPTYILYSYFIQKPKINKVVSGFICIIVVIITAQLNLNYREALQTFLIFISPNYDKKYICVVITPCIKIIRKFNACTQIYTYMHQK